jgi:hypothetical protein
MKLINSHKYLIWIFVTVLLSLGVYLIICIVMKKCDNYNLQSNCATSGQDVYNPTIFPDTLHPLSCCDGQPSRKTGSQFLCPQSGGGGYIIPRENIKVGTKRGNYTLSFVDLFANTNQWTINDSGLDRLTNTCAKYTKDNISTDANGLIVKAGPNISGGPKNDQCCGWNPGGFTECADDCVLSGRVQSNFSQKYGVFIFAAKVPKGDFLFPALWLAGTGSWPETGEIDMMETVSSTQDQSTFSSRIMVPLNSDFLNKGSDWWKAVSIPPNESDLIQQHVDLGFWNDYHVFALDWKQTDDGDVKYDFYIDVKMSDDGVLTDIKSGKPGIPNKSYSLKDLVNTYRTTDGANLAPFEKIRDAVGPQQLVINIAISGRNDKADKCSNLSCSNCVNINNTMNVEYVQVWK